MITQEDLRWLKAAKQEAEHSIDPSRKTGCVIRCMGANEVYGHNAFPAGVEILPERLQRPAKYEFMEHAERNAIYHAARYGVSLYMAVVYLPWFPCAPCARALVQVGISRLVCVEPDWSETRYGFHEAKAILVEGGVILSMLPFGTEI